MEALSSYDKWRDAMAREAAIRQWMRTDKSAHLRSALSTAQRQREQYAREAAGAKPLQPA